MCVFVSPHYLDPVDPVRPEDITFMDVKSDSVIIQWTVAYISYSPETYVVQYGTSRDSLIHNSRSTDSEEGEMMSYSVELSGLRDNTIYYVQVLATNTAQRSNRSSIQNFTTLPLTTPETGAAFTKCSLLSYYSVKLKQEYSHFYFLMVLFSIKSITLFCDLFLPRFLSACGYCSRWYCVCYLNSSLNCYYHHTYTTQVK